MDGLIANIEEIRGNGSRAVVIIPNIEAIRDHPSAHMFGLLLVRSLTSSAAHIISRKEKNMLRVGKQGFKVRRARRNSQGFLYVFLLGRLWRIATMRR